MRISLIGLGRMGTALALQSLEKGIDVVAYNRSAEKVELLKDSYEHELTNTNHRGTLIPVTTVADVVKNLQTPRVVMLMLTAGKAVDDMIEQLLAVGLEKGDVVIDAGNSFYKDSIRRHDYLQQKGIHFLDMGTSGGIDGARHGACLTIGGEKEVYDRLEALFKTLACPDGYGYVGPAGAGHFVKVTHNGVEYGMLQAIGEGFGVLEKGSYTLDFAQIAKIWSHGSVIRGWLMELAEKAFENDAELSTIEGVVGGGETGKWTQSVAQEELVDVPVLDAAIKAREASQLHPTFAGKVIAAIRNGFGGHEVKTHKL